MTKQRGKLDQPDLLVSKAYVGGQWIAGDGQPVEVDDPYTLEPIGEVPGLGKQAAGEAIEAADEAFPRWAAQPAKDRGAILRKWFDLIEAHGEDLARIMVRENGKTLADARAEVAYANGFMQFFADRLQRVGVVDFDRLAVAGDPLTADIGFRDEEVGLIELAAFLGHTGP